MLIELDDPSVLDDLVEFMHVAGCLAVVRGAAKVEVTPATTKGEDADRANVARLLDSWRGGNPDVQAVTLD